MPAEMPPRQGSLKNESGLTEDCKPGVAVKEESEGHTGKSVAEDHKPPTVASGSVWLSKSMTRLLPKSIEAVTSTLAAAVLPGAPCGTHASSQSTVRMRSSRYSADVPVSQASPTGSHALLSEQPCMDTCLPHRAGLHVTLPDPVHLHKTSRIDSI